MLTKRDLLRSAALAAIVASTAKSVSVHAQTSADRPRFFKAKDIAARAVANRLECGSVWINKHGAIQPNAPFGGIKQSGVGVEFGIDGLKEFTTIQTVFC